MASFWDVLLEKICGRGLFDRYHRSRLAKQALRCSEQLDRVGFVPSVYTTDFNGRKTVHASAPSNNVSTRASSSTQCNGLPVYQLDSERSSPIPIPMLDKFLSPEGPPDITAMSLTDEQHHKLYKVSDSWDPKSSDLPPLGPMKGLGLYRRSARCNSETDLERYKKRLLQGPPVEGLHAEDVLGLHPDTIKEVTLSSDTASSSTFRPHNTKIIDSQTGRVLFHQQIGFRAPSVRSKRCSRNCAPLNLEPIQEECIMIDTTLEHDPTFGSNATNAPRDFDTGNSPVTSPLEDTINVRKVRFAPQSPKGKGRAPPLDSEPTNSVSNYGSIESTKFSFDVAKKMALDLLSDDGSYESIISSAEAAKNVAANNRRRQSRGVNCAPAARFLAQNHYY